MIQFTSRGPDSVAGQFRGRLLLALLGLASLLIIALVWQAWTTEQAHRRTAERTLHDHAISAAWLFRLALSSEMSERMDRVFIPVLSVPGSPTTGGFPPLDLLRTSADTIGLCGNADDSLRFYFRLDLRNGDLVTLGARPTREVLDAVRDSVRLRLPPDGMWYSVSPFREMKRGVRSLVFAGRLQGAGNPVVAYGFETCAGTIWQPLLAQAVRDFALLSPSLTGGLPNDSLLSVIALYGEARDTIFRSEVNYGSGPVGVDGPLRKGGLIVQVSLRPELADQLVIGGTPRSRLPVLLSLLGMTLIVMLVAVRQLRREQELTAVRSDFVSSVSHELRTPLTQIQLFAETLHLGRAPSTTERAFAVEVILHESRRLIHLVENVLRFAGQPREPASLEVGPVALEQLVRGVVRTFEPLASPRGVSIRLAGEAGVTVVADPGALRQVLLNLLDNAVKFGPAGQVIAVGVQRTPLHGVLSVEDDGPGVALEHRHRVWLPFVRIERDANSAPGTGIGLAVVHDLVGRMAGRVRVETGPRGGALFVVELPLALEGSSIVETAGTEHSSG